MRTREQIIADCEKRFEELRAESDRRRAKAEADAKDVRNVYSCRTCRFAKWDRSGFEEWHCREPLVVGFGEPVRVGSWSSMFTLGKAEHHKDRRRPGAYETFWHFPAPCGPEKALWQPKPTICERIIAFLTGADA